jgi:hypothetical protein
VTSTGGLLIPGPRPGSIREPRNYNPPP